MKDGYDRYLRKALIVSKPKNCALPALRLNGRQCHVKLLSSKHTTQAFDRVHCMSTYRVER